MDTTKYTPSEARARGYDPGTVAKILEEEAANAEARSLIPEIEAAFHGVPRPGITLSVAT